MKELKKHKFLGNFHMTQRRHLIDVQLNAENQINGSGHIHLRTHFGPKFGLSTQISQKQ